MTVNFALALDSAAAGRAGRRSRAILIAIAVVVLGADALAPSVGVHNLIGCLVGLSTVVAIGYGVREHRPSIPSAWYWIAAAQGVWSVERAAAGLRSDAFDRPGTSAPVDIIALLGYPVLIVGLGYLVKGRTGLRRDPGTLLDSGTATAGVSLLGWVLLARPTLERIGTSPWPASLMVAHLALDLLVIGGMFRMISSPGRRSGSLRYALVALGLAVSADILTTTMNLVHPGATSGARSLWLLSFLCWSASALHPSMAQLTDPVAHTSLRFRGLRLIGVVLASLIAPALLALHEITGVRVDYWALILGSVAIFMLVIVRMIIAIDQIANSHEALESLQDELAVQATHDPLTGLPNRTHAMRSLAAALGRARRTRANVGLLFVDLDGFKAVNDELGHRMGDEVLRQVAERILLEIRDGDFAARLGGDEFVVGIADVTDEESTVGLADRLISGLSQPFVLAEGVTVQIGASVGIAIGRGGSTDVETLLHEADLAVYRAKNSGRGRAEIFNHEARAALKKHTDTERALTAAITNDELVLYYQPIFNLAEDQVDGFEALVRWNRPGVGLLAPEEFLPVAESTDLICDLDVWALRTALKQLSEWNAQRGVRDLHVAVNISGRHISKQRILVDVAEVLLDSEVDPGQLVLEITETALMDGTAGAANLGALRNAGVVISLDDFGTGYHSSAQLSRLPIDLLKIDRHYVDANTPSDISLLELMVKAAHAFGVRVIAEGIERQDQLDLVRELGCESAQGFFLGHPALPQPMYPDSVWPARVS